MSTNTVRVHSSGYIISYGHVSTTKLNCGRRLTVQRIGSCDGSYIIVIGKIFVTVSLDNVL